jgi:exodeoxyribonuclease-3
MSKKITTWNVNGLRAVLNKEGFAWLKVEKPDILCLQEIKARPDQLSDDHIQQFDGYYQFWNPAERPGYSGVATLTLQEPDSIHLGLGAEQFDQEGRVVRTYHPDFLLFNIYFPNGQRDRGRVEFKLDFYAHLLEMCDQLHADGKQIIICGDFNTAHREIDLRNPKQNETTSGFLPEERVWIDKYLEHGFVDAYRYLYPERVQYTWWTYRLSARKRNIGWRLDYFLVSEALIPRVNDVIIHEDIMGSDHCPVSLLLK